MTYTTTHVSCPDCSHRLVELTGDKEKMHLRNDNAPCTGYECPVEGFEFHQHGVKIEGGGCGARFDLEGNRLDG